MDQRVHVIAKPLTGDPHRKWRFLHAFTHLKEAELFVEMQQLDQFEILEGRSTCENIVGVVKFQEQEDGIILVSHAHPDEHHQDRKLDKGFLDPWILETGQRSRLYHMTVDRKLNVLEKLLLYKDRHCSPVRLSRHPNVRDGFHSCSEEGADTYTFHCFAKNDAELARIVERAANAFAVRDRERSPAGLS